MQKYTIDQICAQRNKAITSLTKLQSLDVTAEEFVNIHEFLNGARLENAVKKKLFEVTEILHKHGVVGMTFSEVMGSGRKKQ